MSQYGNAYPTTAYEESIKYNSDVQKKIKRPGFLARWFLKKLTEGAEWERRQNQENGVLTVDSIKMSRGTVSRDHHSTSIDQPERALHFTVYVANGGRVVETRRYDRKTDRNTHGLYVVNNDMDFGKEIDKIITMESLRG
jgi:hypothetical protein